MYSEYNMSPLMAKELLNSRKPGEKKMDPHDYLCKVVNEQFGLLYPCIKVNTSL